MEGRAPILPSILHHLVLHPAVALSRRGFFIKLTNCRTDVSFCNERAIACRTRSPRTAIKVTVQITAMRLRINLQTDFCHLPLSLTIYVRGR
jgi:hypothetical protein